jgi:ribosome maturation factor RimP
MSLKEELENIIVSPIEREGFELVELKLSQYKSSNRVQVYIDSDHGVMLDDCVRVSKSLESIIEEAGMFKGKYTLEVSSPGLDRPLRTFRDFSRRIGETVEIFFEDAGTASIKGKLIGAEGDQIELELKDETKKLELAGIRMGKIIF